MHAGTMAQQEPACSKTDGLVLRCEALYRAASRLVTISDDVNDMGRICWHTRNPSTRSCRKNQEFRVTADPPSSSSDGGVKLAWGPEGRGGGGGGVQGRRVNRRL